MSHLVCGGPDNCGDSCFSEICGACSSAYSTNLCFYPPCRFQSFFEHRDDSSIRVCGFWSSRFGGGFYCGFRATFLFKCGCKCFDFFKNLVSVVPGQNSAVEIEDVLSGHNVYGVDVLFFSCWFESAFWWVEVFVFGRILLMQHSVDGKSVFHSHAIGVQPVSWPAGVGLFSKSADLQPQ